MSNQPDRWEGFLTNIGQGIAALMFVIAIIALYKGCNDKPVWPL